MDDKQEILVAIAELKRDSKHLEDYIYKELKPDIEKLCKKVESCTEDAAECYTKNLKWIVATVITSIIAVTSLAAVIMIAV
jgi:hypothetical protein